MSGLKGLATGIGSLPYKDAQEALDLVFKYTPNIPFWPQLPKRDSREGMLAQFTENLPLLKVAKDGVRFLPHEMEDGALESFYERIIGNDVEYFKISEDYAQGFYAFCQRLEKQDLKDVAYIKCHDTGPFTFAASLKDVNGVSLLHDAVFFQVILKGLAMKALWQIEHLRKFGKKIILFFDEPYLAGFGSAYTPVNREGVVSGLVDFTQGLTAPDVLIGVHCCGNTDWSIFTDVSGINIINFDAFDYQEKFVLYADNLKGFLKRGGIICWGVVPTQESGDKLDPDLLSAKVLDGVNLLVKKGLDRQMLSNQLLISPACGLGSLEPQNAEMILKALSQTSQILRKNL